MTLWTEEGNLGFSKMKNGFEDFILDRTAILLNKILELPKGAKRLQSNSDFTNKIEERSNTALLPSPWKR